MRTSRKRLLLICSVFVSVVVFLLWSRSVSHERGRPLERPFLSLTTAWPTTGRPRTLIIIQGQYRTLDLTIDSIVDNIVLPNQPCDVALSLDARETDVSATVIRKLQPFLVRSFFSDPDDARGQLAMIEFQQTLKPLTRIDLSKYGFVLRSRSDVYVARPFPMMLAFGFGDDFATAWRGFCSHMNTTSPAAVLQAWFMTSGMPFYLNVTVRRTPPAMVWSPCNAYEFNEPLLQAIRHQGSKLASVEDVVAVQEVVQSIARDMRVMFTNGGLYVHFGAASDMLEGKTQTHITIAVVLFTQSFSYTSNDE
jgi:hypothetical protein